MAHREEEAPRRRTRHRPSSTKRRRPVSKLPGLYISLVLQPDERQGFIRRTGDHLPLSWRGDDMPHWVCTGVLSLLPQGYVVPDRHGVEQLHLLEGSPQPET